MNPIGKIALNRSMGNYLALLFVFLLYGCSPSNPYEQIGEGEVAINLKLHEAMDWLLTANPKADAYDAYSSGDYKFYALQLHHRISIPIYENYCQGWGEGDSRDKVISSAVKYIEGAGYGSETYEHRKLDAIARVYIKDYNSTLWFHLREDNDFECIS